MLVHCKVAVRVGQAVTYSWPAEAAWRASLRDSGSSDMIGCSSVTSYHHPLIPLAETACHHNLIGSSGSLELSIK